MTTPFQKMLQSLTPILIEDGSDSFANMLPVKLPKDRVKPTLNSKDFIKPPQAMPVEQPYDPWSGPIPPGMEPVPCADDPTTICGWDANGDGIADYGYQNILIIIGGQQFQILTYTLVNPDGITVAMWGGEWAVCGETSDGNLLFWPGMQYIPGAGQGAGSYVMVVGPRIWICVGNPFDMSVVWVNLFHADGSFRDVPLYWSGENGQTSSGYSGWLATLGIQGVVNVPLVPFIGPGGSWVPGTGWVGDWYEEGQNPEITGNFNMDVEGGWRAYLNVNLPTDMLDPDRVSNKRIQESFLRTAWNIYLQYWRQTHPGCKGDECFPPRGTWPDWWDVEEGDISPSFLDSWI
jgi:hypothetical protein|tara:strand:+ start:111 stop:1154 length:1044 start_codon:yes stop_codon:yes gene_type:complete